MSVIEGFVTEKELKQIEKRPDVSVLEVSDGKDEDKEWEGHKYVKLDCDWSIMEMLENFEG